MKLVYVVFTLCCLLSCKDRTGTKPEPAQKAVSAPFPVSAFLEGQINQVDSMRLPISKYTTINNHTDSSLISIRRFDSLAGEFLHPDISQEKLGKFYKESSFADQSIPSATINYTCTNKDMEVQRIDITIRPDPVASDQVETIYMEKLTRSGDSSILKKIYWKTDHNFQVVTSTSVAGSPPTFNQVKVVWNPE